MNTLKPRHKSSVIVREPLTIGIILAAGDGKRSVIEHIPIYKGNLPLPDGTTPIARLLAAYEREPSIKAVYIATRDRTHDFEGILDSNWEVPVSIVDDCYGDTYPLISLRKCLEKVKLPNLCNCVVSVCDHIFDYRLNTLLSYDVDTNQMLVARSGNKLVGCLKLKKEALENLCQYAADKSNTTALVSAFESRGGVAIPVDIGTIDIGSRESYLEYIITEMIPNNKYLQRVEF